MFKALPFKRTNASETRLYSGMLYYLQVPITMNKLMKLHLNLLLIECDILDIGSNSDMLCDLTSISIEDVDIDQDEIVCVMQNFYCVPSVFFEF